MRRLSTPVFSARVTFSTCVSRARPATLRSRLISVGTIVENADIDYQAKAVNGTLHQVAPGDTQFGGIVNRDELVAVYTGRMVPKKSPGRHIYNTIMSSAPNGRCPLCTVGTVTTLDHVLPKFHFPALVVAPLNLVPSCRDCNTTKKTQTPNQPSDIFLHPYYDNVENQKWLVANVLQPLAITFDINCPTTWPQLLRDRVRHHFEDLGLAKLFGSNAADQLSVLKGRLEPLLAAGGPTEVANYLLGEATAFRGAHINSWQTAMYEAIASDPWYIGGGFNF